MKKSIIIPLAAVLCLSLLAGCNAKDSATPPNSKQANTSARPRLQGLIPRTPMKSWSHSKQQIMSNRV